MVSRYIHRRAANAPCAVQLAALDHLRQEFIALVSHDLRTPLTAAKAGLGLLDAYLAERLQSTEHQRLDNARRNIEPLDRLISDLLAYNQLAAGVLQLERQALDLRAVVAEAVATVQPLIHHKGQTLALELREALPIEGDAWRLGQVVVNLLANAHEHTPPGTAIHIVGWQAQDAVLLTVSDTGPGIPSAALPVIFERFRRLDDTRSGSGLGLAIVKGIVELHGGRIWVESQPGHGTSFFISLPYMKDGGTWD